VGAQGIDGRALIACSETVLSCFLSFTLVVLATKQLRTVLGTMWDEEGAYEIMAVSGVSKDDSESPHDLVLAVLCLSTYILSFFQDCLDVAWPRVLSRGPHLTSATCSDSQIRGFPVHPRMEGVNKNSRKISERWTQGLGLGVGSM